MAYWEDQLEFVKQVIKHANEENVDNFAVTYDHYVASKPPLKVTLTVQFRDKKE